MLILLGGAAWGISADLGEIGVGARPLSIGKAYVGYAEDASAIFLNPAGMEDNPELGLVSTTGKLLEDITYTSIGLTNPIPFGTIGVGYINAATYGIPLTTLTRTTTEVVINQYGVTDYSSSLIFLSLAKDIRSNLFAGGSLKIFTQGFSLDSGSLEGGSGTGIDLDLGLKWKARKGIAFGATCQNILPANLGGKFTWKKGYEEGIPSILKLGSAFKVWGDDGLYQFRGQKLLWNLDLEMNPSIKRPGLWHTGLEWWYNSFLALRGGVDQKAKALETGIGVDNNFTAGVGFKYRGFSFDYAYHQYGDLSENTAHFFSIGYLGEKEPKKLEDKFKEKAKSGLTAELKEVKGLKHFSDVPENYWAKDPIEYLATLGIVNGYPDDTFHPDAALNRAELAALLVKAKEFEVSRPERDLFPDVAAANWAAPYIEVALKKKYVAGYPDGNYRPWKEVTRAEAIVVISRFAGLTEPLVVADSPFPDVPKNHWAARSIFAARQAGMLEYLSGGNFEPDTAFTRAEAAEVLSKTDFAKEKIKELLKK